jgi:hypothetical protein
MMLRTHVMFVLIGLMLLGCAMEAHLYPANEVANPTGVLTGHFMAYGVGHGEVEITMPDGELVKGEYSLIRSGTVGFGSIFGAVYGRRGSVTVTSTSTSVEVPPGGEPGMASGFGNKGTSIQCEFYNGMNGHGYGACQTSTGALYRIQY